MTPYHFCFEHVPSGPEDLVCQSYWPNLVKPQSWTPEQPRPGHFSQSTPYADFPRLLDFMRFYDIPYQIHPVASAPMGCIYPIDIYFFDFAIDYLGLLSNTALDRLRRRQIQILLTYCEADSIPRIDQRMRDLCATYQVSPAQIKILMQHTFDPDEFSNFHQFNTDFYFCQAEQHSSKACAWSAGQKTKRMTYLNRAHKNWRAFMAGWYCDRGYHHDSYFSYCAVEVQGDQDDFESNPLKWEIKKDPAWIQWRDHMLDLAPFYADDLTDSERNNHESIVSEFYADAYWNLVAETFLALEDDWPGVFLTEKTWKPIANAQPFVILGNAGSLAYLRSLGYRTFAEAGVDESYDEIQDNTERFLAVCALVQWIHGLSDDDLHALHLQCRDIVQHNQRIFWQDNGQQIRTLLENITGVRCTHPSR